ncbi:hypothetical protein GALL_366450 [mine drainage metagenome]|uniref:Uncharacterized protein n=1 Tax=mine drainage metagenome TaxID=410659 RepID=A0A1J5QVS1_9ZZZZ
MAAWSCAAAPSARARVSGLLRVQTAWSASRIAVSTARRRASMRWMSPRGTLPAASHLSWIARRVRFAAARSVRGSSCSASAISASLTSRLARNSVSVAVAALSRAAKNVSWAARNRAQSASSSCLLARPAAFQSFMRSRYALAVAAQSVEVLSASACATSWSLAVLACEFRCSSSAKKCRRSRSNVVRAWLKRFQSDSSTGRSSRGPVLCDSFHWSRSTRSCSPAGRHWIRSGSVPEIRSAASTISVRTFSAASFAAARSASARARRSRAIGRRASRRSRRASRSPTAAGSASSSVSLARVWSISLTARSVAVRRVSKTTTLAWRSRKRRTYSASASSPDAPGNWPTARSPADSRT